MNDITKVDWKVFRFSTKHNWKVDTGKDWFVDCGLEGEANAHLIAAAPNLYEALRAAWNEDIDTSVATHQLIAKALAKAERR